MGTMSAQFIMREEHILDDRDFLMKFIFLMLMIALLASYILFQGFITVDKLSLPFNSVNFSSFKLGDIEKRFNSNSIDLTIDESDFEGLSELDLSDIEILDIEDKALVAVEEIASAEKATDASYAPTEIKKPKSIEKPVPVQARVQKEVVKKNVFISSQNVDSLSFIKKKFYATNNISFSLLLAEKFFEKSEYEKALKWALISNEIDETNEKSWVLFAKSKIKLGKRQEALNALNIYLKDSDSTHVKKILDDIKKIS